MKRVQGNGSVTITWREADGLDDMLMPTYTEHSVTVNNVLVADGSQTNTPADTMPDAVKVAKTMYLPRTFTWRSLKGAHVAVNGDTYVVVGDPTPVSIARKVTGYHPVGVQLARME